MTRSDGFWNKNRTMSGILRVSLPIEFHQAFSTPLVDTSEMYRSYQSISIVHSATSLEYMFRHCCSAHLVRCPIKMLGTSATSKLQLRGSMEWQTAKWFQVSILIVPLVGITSSFLSSSACRKCACTWAYVICGETSPSWLCRDEYQWVSGCASCICWTVVLRVSSRPTADVWNTRCNAEWWRHLLNQFKTSQVCRCSRWKNMEIWCQQSIPQEPPSHNHMYGLKMRDHNAMDFGCSRNCHIWVKCNRYNCHELRLGLQSLTLWDRRLHQLLHEIRLNSI